MINSTKYKLLKTKNSFFIRSWKNKNNLLIVFLFLFLIILFILISFIILNSKLDILEKFKTNYKFALQMILTGTSLGVSSYLLQRITKNKLSDTSVMGFGNFNLIPFVLLALNTNFSQEPSSSKLSLNIFETILPFVFILTSSCLCLIFNLFSFSKTKISHSKLLISGIILNFVSIALAFSLKTKLDFKANTYVQQYITGFIYANPLNLTFYVSIGSILLVLFILILFSYHIKLFIINQEIATQVGISNKWISTIVLVCIGILVGSSYSLTGDFVFVGLIAGNITFYFFKNKISYGIIGSAMIGSILILISYFILNTLAKVDQEIIPQLIPLIISPYFLFLVFKMKTQPS